ncbi:MAG: LacI family transcriptional regulator, partial [Clostridiales bacterium]|nr:LacI family transcriptional regulator [Clostridiales bacterium]
RCYREVLAEFGLPFLEENVASVKYWAQPAAAITLQLIQEREKLPDAIFCANDLMAMGCIEALKQLGKKIPEDVAVIGFDDIGSSIRIPYPLSSISAPKRAFARACFDLLYRRIGGDGADFPRREVFGVALAARGSTAEI